MNDYDVAKIFEQIELQLIASMKRNLRGHELEENVEGFKWEQWQSKKLRELRKFRKDNKAIFKANKQKLDIATRIDIIKQFFEGAGKVDKEVKEAIKKGYMAKRTPGDDFFGKQNKKLESMIKSINADMEAAETACLRKMDDIYRATLYKSQMFVSSGASTVSQAVDMATKDFLAKGITCITYSDGRNVGISTWARMAIRTANKRAFLMGEGERRKEWGESLVLVSQYLQCSPTCQPWQGKIYIDDVWSGGKSEDGPYPLLSLAIAGGLYHPNCRHTHSTYFKGISTLPEPMSAEVTQEEYEKARREAYINQNIRKYQRLKEGSTDQVNIDKYKAKEKEWRSRKDIVYKSKFTDLLNEYNNGQNDVLIHRNIEKNMRKSPIGQEIIKYLEDNPIPINIYYNVDVPESLMGMYDPFTGEISIYASNTKSLQRTAEIIIHEVTHARYDIGDSLWSECVCRAQELKHRCKRNKLTSDELRNIIKSVKNDYPEFAGIWRKE